MLRVLKAVLLVMALFPVPSSAGVYVTETLVTYCAAHQYDGAISGDNVSYTNLASGHEDIYRAELVHFGSYPVITDPGNQFDSDIDGTRIVYVDPVYGDLNVFLHDFGVDSTHLLSYDAGKDAYPAISGDNVVYVSDRGGTDDIYWHDFSVRGEYMVTNDYKADGAPAVNGELAAWHAPGDSANDVYAVELGGSPFLVTGSSEHELYPSVSGDRIAYEVHGSDTYSVEVYDHSTGQTTRITSEERYLQNVRITGDYVLWNDNPDANYDIFIHDLSTGRTYTLIDEEHDQYLTDVDGNRAVYHDYRTDDLNVWVCEWEIINTAFTSMQVVGDFNGWDTNAPAMTLFDDCLWLDTLTIDAGCYYMKFLTVSTWAVPPDYGTCTGEDTTCGVFAVSAIWTHRGYTLSCT